MFGPHENLFINLTSKLLHLRAGCIDTERSNVKSLLDTLNGLDYRFPVVANNTRPVLLINQLCTIIRPDDKELVCLTAKLIYSLIKEQKVVIEGCTLQMTIEWLLETIKHDPCKECLQALDAIIRDAKTNVQNVLGALFESFDESSALFQLISNRTDLQLVLLALQCVEATFSLLDDCKCELFHPGFKSSLQLFYQFLKKQTVNEDKVTYNKILINCLKSVQVISTECDCILNDEYEMFLGICKSYMAYGLKGITFLVPCKLLPSIKSVPESNAKALRQNQGGRIIRHRKRRSKSSKSAKIKEVDVETVEQTTSVLTADFCRLLKTSDSDLSDVECNAEAKLSQSEAKVRQAALNLLLNVRKRVENHVLVSYWPSFIPESPLISSHSLSVCILKDPSPKGRLAALNVLLSMLFTSKGFLAQAEHSNKTTSFIPFSVTLGIIIKELHHCLCLALNEHYLPVLIQVLKCLELLVRVSKYNKLAPGLITKVVRNIKQFVFHKDCRVQVAALLVLEAVLASVPTVQETTWAFLRNFSAATELQSDDQELEFDPSECYSSLHEQEESTKVEAAPWLVETCVKNLSDSSAPIPVKLQCLEVLSALCLNHFEALILNQLSAITNIVAFCLSEPSVQYHAERTCEILGESMHKYHQLPGCLELSLCFWQSLLQAPLVKLLNNEDPNLRAVACNCLCTIGSAVFELLPRDKQLLCITSLLSLTRDANERVKGCAIRAVSKLVLIPSIRQDLGFVMDMIDVLLVTMVDENAIVRVKASWSLGNLSDALVSNSRDNVEELPLDYLQKLMKTTVEACGSNDRHYKANAVRALGNLLQVVPAGISVQEPLKVLLNCCASDPTMKIRWNACYSLGSVLKTRHLYEQNVAGQIFKVLGDLVENFCNLKVRINAAQAIACCPSREFYGASYGNLWMSLIKGLENSKNIDDLNEYMHRDNLIEQICLCIAHLTSLLTIEDLASIEEILTDVAFLKSQMHRIRDTLSADKTTVFFATQERLNFLAKHEKLGKNQQQTVGSLKEIFTTTY